MKIDRINLGVIDQNCYTVLTEESAILIDPGYYSEKIASFLRDNSDKKRCILITHCHFDHIGAVKKLQSEFNIKVAVGRFDVDGLKDNEINLSSKFRMFLEPITPDILLDDLQTLTIGDLTVKTYLTPGHTKGSVCYLIGNNLFTGDTLFYETYGRTDFPGSDINDMLASFYKIITTFDKDTTVYPGHGQKTSIAHEAEYNPLIDTYEL